MTAIRITVGCVQVAPDDKREANIDRACDGVRTAARKGASLVLMPEYVSFLHASGRVMRESARFEHEDPALPRFKLVAREQRVWLVAGSLVLMRDDERIVNRSFVIDADGEVVARYDKIHMFDATLPGGRVIRESSTYASGTDAVVVDTPRARIGMSICYDLRFPLLYRALAQAGAEVLVVPSAFTKATGVMHWKALLQARAIENGAYVIAPATCGIHPGGHETYGHSLIVDPTGRIVASAGTEPDVVCAELDLAMVETIRARIPSLTHDRAFTVTQVRRAAVTASTQGTA